MTPRAVLPKADPSHASNRLTRRNYHGPHLLTQFKGKSTTQSSPTKETKSKAEFEPDIEASPISSSDEAEDESPRSPDMKFSEKEESRWKASKAIKAFQEEEENEVWDTYGSTREETEAAAKKCSLQSCTPQRHSGLVRRSQSSPKRPTPFANDETTSFDDDWAFPSSQPRKRRKPNSTYSRPNIHASFKQPPNSKVEAPKTSTEGGPGFRQPVEILGFEDGMSEGKSDGKDIKFQNPREISVTSPVLTRKTRYSLKNDLPDASSGFIMPSANDVDPEGSLPLDDGPGFSMPSDLPVENISSSPLATAAEQKIFDDDDGASTPLSSATSMLSITLSQDQKEFLASDLLDHHSFASTARCPMCKGQVERSFLEEFNNGKKLKVRDQTRFCQAHKKRNAEVEWQKRRYPSIGWSNFEARIEKHCEQLAIILRSEQPSYYRNALESTAKTGRERTTRQILDALGLENLSAGYYGSRGSRVMYVKTL